MSRIVLKKNKTTPTHLHPMNVIKQPIDIKSKIEQLRRKSIEKGEALPRETNIWVSETYKTGFGEPKRCLRPGSDDAFKIPSKLGRIS